MYIETGYSIIIVSLKLYVLKKVGFRVCIKSITGS